MKFISVKFSCFMVTAAAFLFSCSSSNNDTDSPPEVPSAQSMKVDFSDMENANGKTTAKVAESNFTTALVAAGIAKVILDVNLAIPRALLEAAQNQTAEPAGDGEWEWSYSTSANGESYSASLIATVESSDEVTWNFFVSNSAANIDNALWFSGTSDFEATSGTWNYYDLQSGEEVSRLTWERGENTASVNLDVQSDRNNNIGDSISYEFDGTVKMVAYFDASQTETSTISYNTETMTGFIIAPNYNDGVKACWDSDLNNTACSD